MTLLQVCEWLETSNIFQNYYVGKIDGSKMQTLGVYSGGEYIRPVHALGEPSKYEINRIRLLIHWNKDAQETQDAAIQLFNFLTDTTQVAHAGEFIYYVALTVSEPISIGTDANDIYEYVITFDLYTKRS